MVGAQVERCENTSEDTSLVVIVKEIPNLTCNISWGNNFVQCTSFLDWWFFFVLWNWRHTLVCWVSWTHQFFLKGFMKMQSLLNWFLSLPLQDSENPPDSCFREKTGSLGSCYIAKTIWSKVYSFASVLWQSVRLETFKHFY